MVEEDCLHINGRDGRTISVRVRVSPRARRIALRVDSAKGTTELVLPAGFGIGRAGDFLARHAGWLEERVSRMPQRIVFADGARVPLLGTDHVIRHDPRAVGTVRRFAGGADGLPELVVSGRPEHLPRRLADWLKAEARREIAPRARAHAERLGRKPSRITVRDTRSRWGSCSSTGALSFSWRLVLAPEAVLDYVCAHEAAHLVEMNHSGRFWRLVETLDPDMDAARAWLKRHGAGLHRYG